MNERRKFSRTRFRVNATLRQNETCWDTEIIDLSLNGASIQTPPHFQSSDDTMELQFTFPDDVNISLKMKAVLIHKQAEHLGVKCVHIDVETINHLRKIIEQNLGDTTLLHRELELLIANYDSLSPPP